MTRRLTATLAGAAILSLALSGCGLISSSGANAGGADAIDPSEVSSLTLTVTDSPESWAILTEDTERPQSLPLEGKVVEEEELENSGDPLAGIDIGIYRVEGFDLIDSSSLAPVETLSNEVVEEGRLPSKYVAEPVSSSITNDQGRVEFTGLDVGVYFVTQIDRAGEDMYPFIVTLPTRNIDTGNWSYDVSIYR